MIDMITAAHDHDDHQHFGFVVEKPALSSAPNPKREKKITWVVFT
jgi:hypothetical protein